MKDMKKQKANIAIEKMGLIVDGIMVLKHWEELHKHGNKEKGKKND